MRERGRVVSCLWLIAIRPAGERRWLQQGSALGVAHEESRSAVHATGRCRVLDKKSPKITPNLCTQKDRNML
ncbi:unnamed protein product [Arctia plantaginis]|uniref:Uncharacterized protein n=1 Tax=Arctia plantaginis TaxID=874455 RepID=A0A8S1ASK3_ARCPL|nr:unnamed protein product [Arctia plantaginis]